MANMTEQELREAIAEIEHEQWIAWATALMEREQLSPERIERWKKLIIPYSELTEEQKDQDRIWADVVMSLIRANCHLKGKQVFPGFITIDGITSMELVNETRKSMVDAGWKACQEWEK